MNKTYHIKFLLNGWHDDQQGIDVLARNKEEAYDKAVYEVIPQKYGRCPFGAYVASVTYNNGNHRDFNYDYGNAY